MQKRIRRAMADFAIARHGGDDLTTISALMTESLGSLFELINTLGFAPTEEQFVQIAIETARIVARGEHYLGVSSEVGSS
ncbi:hypothetical protein CQW49_07565 [Methylosinus trichosporium OB3b]|uniref:Uncharacterized protein n=2 Tax=Methylocystaceae TaxID=31993 RepID=A0A2D2CYG6_METT3|nr:hypothetical protein CQW49_07565 [Methylosinus trichosporium OB3b]OBS51785.1 hypothetical protein A8B73_14070 [Methylosinus sp. 3S-1]